MWSSSLTAKLSRSRVPLAVDVAVDLQQDAALVERRARCRRSAPRRRRASPLGRMWRNLPRSRPAATYEDDVELLARRVERALDAGVERGRDDQLLRQPAVAQQRRQPGEPRVQRGRLEVAVERKVQLVVQGADAVAGRDGLRDVGEAARRVVELEALGQQGASSSPATPPTPGPSTGTSRPAENARITSS